MDLALALSSDEECDWIQDQLIAFNCRAIGREPEGYVQPLNLHYRDGGRIVAGANAKLIAESFAHVAILWVDEAYRGKRLGSRLLAAVENAAREGGAGMIDLDTYDFQARGFYLKQGYVQYAELEGQLPGRTKYFFKKPLL